MNVNLTPSKLCTLKVLFLLWDFYSALFHCISALHVVFWMMMFVSAFTHKHLNLVYTDLHNIKAAETEVNNWIIIF